MIEFLFDILQIAIVVKLLHTGIRWLLFRRRKYRRESIIGKAIKLITNKIHYKLDMMLKAQKEALHPESKTSSGKVVSIRNPR